VQITAERLLLKAALEDPMNQRFLLLSESCVPLYAPSVVWISIMGESRSRIHACATESTADTERLMINRSPSLHTPPSLDMNKRGKYISHSSLCKYDFVAEIQY